MKMFSKIMLVALMTFAFHGVINAQGETAVPFLELAPDSRAGGMGESGAGLADNSAAIYWNPAGLAFQTGTEVSITHSNWLPAFHLDLFYDYLTYKQYVEDLNGTVSGSITYMNFGEFIRTGPDDPTELGKFTSFDAALTLGYATKLSPDWGVGMNFRLIHSRLSDQGTAEEKGSGVATSVSFDVAAMWRPEKLVLPFVDENIGGKLSIGLNISNLGPKIYYIDQAQADPIPTNFRLGFAYKILDDEYNSLIYTLDFNKLLVTKHDSTSADPNGSDPFYKAIFTSWTNKPFSEELRKFTTSMGLEYRYGNPNEDFLFAIRAGYFYEDPSYGNRKFLTFGAGIKYEMYSFDFSYITTDVFPGGENHPLSNTLRFSVAIGWGSVPEKTTGLPRGI
jgi:hypothetical protein